MPNNNNNEYVAEQGNLPVYNVKSALNSFKTEVAAEIGLHNYDSMDKGWLASRQNGYVGGNMTKKMVAYAEAVMGQEGHQAVSQPTNNVIEVPQEIRQLNEAASTNFDGFVNTLQGIQANAAQQARIGKQDQIH